MNVTLALDEDLVRKAREVAQARGTTLNQLIRDHLRLVVGNSDAEETIRRLHESYARGLGDSGGVKIHREDAYEGRLK